MGSSGQLVNLGKPNFRARQDGYAKVEGVRMIGEILSLKEREWPAEIRSRGNDRLLWDSYDVLHHNDGIHSLRTHQTFPKLLN